MIEVNKLISALQDDVQSCVADSQSAVEGPQMIRTRRVVLVVKNRGLFFPSGPLDDRCFIRRVNAREHNFCNAGTNSNDCLLSRRAKIC